MNKVIKQLLARLGRTGRAGRRIGLYVLAACIGLIAIGALLPMLSGEALDESSASVASDEWGAEVLATFSDGASRFSPIALANACGLGASSCFKCHNGKRAALPTADKAIAPWHADHAKVNFSCVGCHQGNPRILKQDIAHQGLVADPRTTEKSCSTCHTAGDAQSLISKYHAAESTGK